MTTGVFDKCGNDLTRGLSMSGQGDADCVESARFAWLTTLTGSCSYVVSAIKCASCSVIAMGRSSQGCAVGEGICTIIGLASVGLGRLLVFKLLFSRVNSLPWRSRSFLLRSCHGPLLGEPGRRRLSRTTHGQLTVLVAPALGKTR